MEFKNAKQKKKTSGYHKYPLQMPSDHHCCIEGSNKEQILGYVSCATTEVFFQNWTRCHTCYCFVLFLLLLEWASTCMLVWTLSVWVLHVSIKMCNYLYWHTSLYHTIYQQEAEFFFVALNASTGHYANLPCNFLFWVDRWRSRDMSTFGQWCLYSICIILNWYPHYTMLLFPKVEQLLIKVTWGTL